MKDGREVWASSSRTYVNNAIETVEGLLREDGLRYDDIERNKAIAHDRVFPEDYFGRHAKMWPIVSKRYTLSRGRLKNILDVTWSLTNYHIILYPLRDRDHKYYQQQLADLVRRGEENANNGKLRQQKYRRRKIERDGVLAGIDDDDDDDAVYSAPSLGRVSPTSTSSTERRTAPRFNEEESKEEDVVSSNRGGRVRAAQRPNFGEDEDEDADLSDDALGSDYGFVGRFEEDDDDDDDDDGLGVEASRKMLQKAVAARSIPIEGRKRGNEDDDDDDDDEERDKKESFVSRRSGLDIGGGGDYSTEEAEFEDDMEDEQEAGAKKDSSSEEVMATADTVTHSGRKRRSKRSKTVGDEAAKSKYGDDFVADGR